jgi:hypothetical protein
MNPVLGLARAALNPLGIALTRPDTLSDLVRDRRNLERMTAFLGFQSALTPEAAARAPLAVSAKDDWFVCATLADRLPDLFTQESLQDG